MDPYYSNRGQDWQQILASLDPRSTIPFDSARAADSKGPHVTIDFSFDRWEKVLQTYRCWWAGRLDRPILAATLGGRDPGRTEPSLPSHAFTAFYDLSVPAAEIVDRWDYDLSCKRFLGDAVPSVYPNFGPGVAAAFLGARLETDDNTVWFHPPEDMKIVDIHFEYDGDNRWLNRVKDICRAAVERWEGLVQIVMTDLGGILDMLSVFRPGEKLLMDLYDHLEHVERLTWEAYELWHRFYREIDEIIHPTNPGYMAWAAVFCPQPYYMLQCDFAYMIGPGMFDRFARPELLATCKRLPNCFYHLDGQGQLPHLASLLAIKELRGIQWVPGPGQPQGAEWIDVYRKIVEAGKLAQLLTLDAVDAVAEQTGRPGNALFWDWEGRIEPEDKFQRALKRYGVA